MNPRPTRKVLGEPMTKVEVVSSRKRVLISRHTTYDAALAAKKANNTYSWEQMQIRRKHDGFHLVARVSTKENN